MAERIGRFVIVREIGRGGSSTVYECLEPKLQRHVAVKVLETIDPDAVLRLERESQLLARLRHPHVVSVHEFVREEGSPFLVMDLVEGGSLSKRIAELRVDEALRLFEELLDAVAYAHGQGILHRDLKPANVLLDSAGRVRLADFGLARSTASVTITGTNEIFGTPLYLAPERIDGAPADERSDVYSLGVILYEMLSGRPPFTGETIPELFRRIGTDVPPDPCSDPVLSAVVRRAMNRDPLRRFPSAKEFLEEIRRIRGHEATLTPVPGRASRWLGAWRRHRRLALRVLAAAAALGAILFGANAVVRGTRIRSHLEEARRHESAGRWSDARAAYEMVLDLDADHSEGLAGRERSRRAEAEQRGIREKIEREKAGRSEAEARAIQLLESAGPHLDRAERLLAVPSDLVEYRAEVVKGRESLEEAARLAPDLAIVRHQLGRAWELEGWDERAEAEWRRAIELDPDFSAARRKLAELLLRRAYFLTMEGGAMAEENRLISEGTRHLEALHASTEDPVLRLRSELYLAYARRDYAKLESVARTAIEADPRRVGVEDCHFFLAVALQKRGQGIEHVHRAIELYPGHLPARYLRTYLLGDANHAQAVADMDYAIRIHPRLSALHLIRAYSLRKLHRYEEALKDIERAEELRPGTVHIAIERAACLGESGRKEEAYRRVTEVLTQEPENVRALSLRAWLQLEEPDFTNGLRDLREALRIDPRDGRSWWILGTRLALEQRYAESIDAFTQALELSEGNTDWYWCRGEAYARLGKTEEALADLSRALEIRPDHVRSLESRILVYIDRGQWASAIADCDRWIQARPGDPMPRVMKGDGLENTGDLRGALREYEEALKIAPEGWALKERTREQIRNVRARLPKE